MNQVTMPQRPPLRRATLPAIAIVSALLLAGCSGPGGSGEQPVPEESPLSKYTYALWGNQEQAQGKTEAEQKETEELVAECMAKEGFEYVPNVLSNDTLTSPADEEDGPERGSLEFAEQYGFGIVDFPGMNEEGTEVPEAEAHVDPNAEYMESLSESERGAFIETLQGHVLTPEDVATAEESTEGSEEFEYNWETEGCYGVAWHEMQGRGGEAAQEDPEFAELFAAIEEVMSEAYGDATTASENDDIAKVDREWSDCMADAGFADFISPDTAQSTLYDEYDALQMPDGVEDEWVEPSTEDTERFQKREIEVAVADIQCREDLGYDSTVQKIQFALEQKFVDEHQTELDALVAQYGLEQNSAKP